MKNLLKKYGGKGMSLKQLAENGLLPDRLELSDICKLTFPDDRQERHALYRALRKAFDDGDLNGDKKTRQKQTTFCMQWVDGTPINEEFQPQYKTETRIWIERDHYMTFLKKVGEWPVDRSNLLSGWFGDYHISTSQKRTSDLPSYVAEALKQMTSKGMESPSYKEAWNYIEAHQDILEWVDTVDGDTLFWVTRQGKKNSVAFNSFRNTHRKAKALLTEAAA